LRYYDPNNGRFNQRDSFSGLDDDPESLHKYLYCNGDPISMHDPTGQQGSLVELMSVISIGLIVSTIHIAPIVGLSLLTGKAPDVLGFGVFGTFKVGPADFFGGIEFDICPRSGQS